MMSGIWRGIRIAYCSSAERKALLHALDNSCRFISRERHGGKGVGSYLINAADDDSYVYLKMRFGHRL